MAGEQCDLDWGTTENYPPGFWRWLRENRRVFVQFERMALRMARSGRKRYSARTIVEVMRWNTEIRDKDKQFKINDHYTPGMARWFMERYGTQYPGFFQLRGQK